MSIHCPNCDATVAEEDEACPECGADPATMPIERVRGNVGALPARAVGALAYFILPAGIFLLVDPYKSNRYARFHSWQGLGWAAAVFAISTILWLVGGIMGLIPVLALMFLSALVGFACLIGWMVLVFKALQGEMWQLPVLGEMAKKKAVGD